MKKEISLATMYRRIEKLGPSLGGVLTYADLVNLIGSSSELQNKRAIRRLVREEVLFKVQRGFYITQNADLWVLACQLKKGSYISMDSVLAKNGLIGTVPAYSVSAIFPGKRKKVFETPEGSLRYYSIQKDLIFGTSRLKNGVVVADSEKAYLDMLYYYTKGARFVIDPLKDVSLWKLDLKKLKKYLRAYKNNKFIKFVEGLTREVP